MRFGHQFIAPEHILLGVLAQPGLAEICESLGVAQAVIIRDVEDALGKAHRSARSPSDGKDRRMIGRRPPTRTRRAYRTSRVRNDPLSATLNSGRL